MRVLVTTAVGKNREGLFYNLFPSRWSTAGAFHSNTYYPFNLGYLSSLLKRDAPDCDVRLIDGNYRNYTIARYAEALIEERPDLIVMEADSLTYAEDMEVLRRVKRETPAKALLCGPYPTYDPAGALRDGADFVALGEFEQSVTDFLRSGCDPATPGIHPNGRSPLIDLAQLPWPEDDDVSRRDYCRMFACEYNEIEVFPTRGCPVNCNYCVVRNIYHGKGNFRTRDPEDVVAEIRHLTTRYPELTGIFFNEESHTADRRYSHRLCQALVDSGLSQELTFDAMCNYAALDDELLGAMKRANYYKVRFGVETLDVENSRQIFNSPWKRDNDKLFRVLQVCKELGIKVYVTLSVGTWGSTAETDLATLHSLRVLREEELVQEFQVSINTPMPGTPFYEIVRKEGFLVNEDPAQQNGMRSCVVSFPDYSKGEIEETFAAFMDFRDQVWRENRERGVRYSQYDEVWVGKVLEMTRAAAGYA